jgi:hypothetical protein
MDKIAAECCGSCEHCNEFYPKCCIGKETGSMNYHCGKDYSPRNPIDNPYKKILNELEIHLNDIQSVQSNKITDDEALFIFTISEIQKLISIKTKIMKNCE